MANDTSRKARMPPNVLLTPLNSRIGSVMATARDWACAAPEVGAAPQESTILRIEFGEVLRRHDIRAGVDRDRADAVLLRHIGHHHGIVSLHERILTKSEGYIAILQTVD